MAGYQQTNRPEWLVPGARVRVRVRCSHIGETHVLTVRAVEWPWLVYFEEMKPGGMHPCNVLDLEPEPCVNAIPEMP